MIGNASQAQLRVLASGAFNWASVAPMISYVLKVGVGAYTHAHLLNSVAIEGQGALAHTLVGVIVAKSIVPKSSLCAVWTPSHTLLILL